ncbi:hypothetical protein BIW11_10740, partial [Tropilaelaps mercedesae]
EHGRRALTSGCEQPINCGKQTMSPMAKGRAEIRVLDAQRHVWQSDAEAAAAEVAYRMHVRHNPMKENVKLEARDDVILTSAFCRSLILLLLVLALVPSNTGDDSQESIVDSSVLNDALPCLEKLEGCATSNQTCCPNLQCMYVMPPKKEWMEEDWSMCIPV